MEHTASSRTNRPDLLPHDAEAEKALIGAVLMDPDAILAARTAQLVAGDFWNPAYMRIYEAATDLADRFEPVDMVTVGNYLDARGQLEELGGRAMLTGLLGEVVSTVYAGHYAELVKRLSRQRRLIATAQEIATKAQEHAGPIESLYDETARLFYGAVDTSAPRSHLYGGDDALTDYLATQEHRRELLARNPDAAITTGLPDLDEMLGDLPAGYLHVIAARPSVGKTMYMEHVAEHAASRRHRVAYYHLELSHQTMLDRRMARWSGVSVKELRRGYNGVEVARAMDIIRPWESNIVYIHCPGWSAERITTDMIRLAARGECDVAIVDYLQKLAMPDVKGRNDAMLYGLMTETLKSCAEQLAIPVVLGSQVSRSFKSRGDQRPHMEDLRNSGEVEEKANQVVMLHRPKEREEGSRATTETLEAYVEKNTTGETGMVRLLHMLGRFGLGCESQATAQPQDEIPF